MISDRQNYCPTADIAAYVDGELSASRELEMELHIASCAPCLTELNEQKRFLRELEFTLHNESDIKLPPDFTRHIVANAESTVSGLRRPAERYKALFICVCLSSFVLFSMAPDYGRVVSGATQIADQVGAVAAFFGHLVYSLFLGVVIILRAIAAQGSDFFAIVALFGAVVLALTAVSKRVVRIGRA